MAVGALGLILGPWLEIRILDAAGVALHTSQSTSIDVDYSFTDMGALGNVHRVSLGFNY